MALKPFAFCTASVFALGLASVAQAQDSAPAADGSTEPTTQEIIVTGVRASLETAQRIKRDSVQVVDSIVAQDIGKLPDNTVSDALQRVTGVQVTRGAGEAGTVLIRGLPNTATLINGRESFTGTARGVSLQDIPAELLAGVDVYKTSTPDLVEGGVAGVIDVRLRRPFDFNGLEVAGSGRAVYSDQADKWGYIGSALVSDRWDTGIGEMGLMLSASYNRRRYEDNTAFAFVSNNIADPDSGEQIGVPDTVGGLYTNGDRQRTAFNGSFQWAPSSDLEFHVDALYTRYKNRYDTDFFVGLPKAGAVTSITANPDYPWLASGNTVENAYTITSNQAYEDKTTTYQVNGGLRYDADDHTTITSELTYNRSKIKNRNMIVDTSFNAPEATYEYGSGAPYVTIDGVDMTDPANFTLRTLFDNHSLAISKQWAWRGDLEHRFDGGLLRNFKIGARYTNRTVTSQATASVPIAAANPVTVDTLPSEFWDLSPNGLVKGMAGIGSFLDANGDYLLSNSDTVRGWFDQDPGARAFEPNLAFFDKELTYAFYGQAGYAFDIGAVPVDGVLGARVVNTVQNLAGNGVDSKQNYVDVLPSFNIRFGLTDRLQLRLAAGKTLTRPNFSDLNPLVTYVPSGDTGIGGGLAGTGSGGNPELAPIKSDSYDATLEFYLNRSTSFTAAAFYRKFDGYIQTYSAVESYEGQNWLVSRPRGVEGTLKGVELAYQQFFDFLPGALSGLGLQANGTYIEGKNDDPINGGTQRLVNVSKWSYNLVGIYEYAGISARLAYNWRSSFVDSYNSGGAQASTILADPTGQLDLSINYDLTPNFTLTLDATNLTDRVYHDHFEGLNSSTGIYSSTPRDTRTYDRTFQVGARFKF